MRRTQGEHEENMRRTTFRRVELVENMKIEETCVSVCMCVCVSVCVSVSVCVCVCV